MKCEYCGGLVTWRGPLSALTHTECEDCGRRNCQLVEGIPADEEDEYINDLQAASGGMCQTPIER